MLKDNTSRVDVECGENMEYSPVRWRDENNRKCKKLFAVTMSFLMIASGITGLLVVYSLSAPTVEATPGDPLPPPDDDPSCFMPGTPINMADGSYKNIEDVEIGDWVKVFSPFTGEIEIDQVGQIDRPLKDNVHKVFLENGKVLEVSANHPFITRDKGWTTIDALDITDINAGKLEVEDYVYAVNANNELEEVKVIDIVPIQGIYKCYDLVDMKYHTYIADDILVHNSGEVAACFVAGTKVSMADGTLKNIEDIREGDKVFSFDLKQDKIIVSTVIQLFTPFNDEGVFDINDGLLRMTGDHPLYVRKPDGRMAWAAIDPELSEANYFKRIIKLEIGDRLVTRNSNGKIISTIMRSIVFKSGGIQTYSFEVDSESHNFFADGILAHNADACEEASCTVTNTQASYRCYGGDVYWYDNCGGRQAKKQECGSTSSSTSYGSWSYYCYNGDVWRERTVTVLTISRGCSGSSCYSTPSFSESTETEKYTECGSTSSWSDTGSTQWVDTSSWSDTGSTRWLDTSSWSDTGSTQWVSDGSECGEKEQKQQSKNQKEQKYQSKNQKEQKYQSRVARGCSGSSCYANTQYQWVDTSSTRTVYQWVDTSITRTVYQWVDTDSTRDVDSYCPSDAYEDSSPLETQWVSNGTECGEKEQKKQYLRDHYCSAGSCTSTLTSTYEWVDTGSTRDTDSLCSADTWVDTGATQVTTPSINNNDGTTYYVGDTINPGTIDPGAGSKKQKQQQWKDYYCSAGGSCTSSMGSYQWVDLGDAITYYYKFDNNNGGTVQDWSTTASYVLQVSDAHDTITYYVKAYDGQDYSDVCTYADKVVANTGPTANFTISDPTATNDDMVTFTDTSSDSDGVGDIVERKWEIIDAKDDTVLETKYGSLIHHQFNIARNHKIKLTVTDSAAASNSEEVEYSVKQKIKLRKNSHNQGRNYITFGAKSSILASELGAQLQDGDTIQKFNTSSGKWSDIYYQKGGSFDFTINRWDHLCIRVSSEVEIFVDPDGTVDESQNLTMDFTTTNKGYNYITWSKSYNITVSGFAENLSISDDVAINIYDAETNIWSTYNPSLPAVFQTDFTIKPYDVICIKGTANRLSINYDLTKFTVPAT